MKIRKLRLQNFRGFEDKTFEFSDQFNVLIGDNGTGKTSILRALSIFVSPFIFRLASIGWFGIEPDDVRQVRFEKGTTLTLEPQYPVSLSCEGILAEEEFNWAIIESKGGAGRGRGDWEIIAAQLREQVQDGKDVLLPLTVYYGTGRRWSTKMKSDWKRPGSRMEGYSGWSEPASNVGLLMGWMKAQEAIALQQTADSVLNVVKQAIASCMESWGDVFYDFKEDDLIARSTDGARALPFRMLSDGERNMLAMVADIARRAAVLNPHLEERALAETPGIVLIDELDLHLHPRWQRRVVDNLREMFPNLQFITTTHSPFIIQALRPGELVDLNERGPVEYENRSIEDIAEDVMGVEVPQRSQRYQEMMEAAEAYYRVLQQAEHASPEEVERLKERLDELSAPFSDNVAYHAFLEMEREAAGLGEHES